MYFFTVTSNVGKLEQISNLNPNKIYLNKHALIAKNIKNELFYNDAQISNFGQITNFKNIKFDVNVKSETKFIISNSLNSSQSWIAIKKKKNNNNNFEQLIYAMYNNDKSVNNNKNEIYPTFDKDISNYFNKIDIIQITNGFKHTVFLDNNGYVYTLGSNFHSIICKILCNR